ncbi:hypothetical protein FA13DRAFT_1719431 [Coprinellus micaceus]|uniref:Uncharacterized protein n=1 Tax=Coprinellus micaceus TaxID=71717 RepID=A0A4Y7SBA4_COPMI|nr:hypothetical protein FA13DRAFT_1719431 [Coprinellus micaceus]
MSEPKTRNMDSIPYMPSKYQDRALPHYDVHTQHAAVQNPVLGGSVYLNIVVYGAENMNWAETPLAPSSQERAAVPRSLARAPHGPEFFKLVGDFQDEHQELNKIIGRAHSLSVSLDAKAKRVDEIEGEWEASDNFRYLADAYLPTLTIATPRRKIHHAIMVPPILV